MQEKIKRRQLWILVVILSSLIVSWCSYRYLYLEYRVDWLRREMISRIIQAKNVTIEAWDNVPASNISSFSLDQKKIALLDLLNLRETPCALPFYRGKIWARAEIIAKNGDSTVFDIYYVGYKLDGHLVLIEDSLPSSPENENRLLSYLFRFSENEREGD